MKYLNGQHLECIELLLEGKTQKEISEKMGLHRNTISNWTREPLFEQEIRKAAVRRSQYKIGAVVDVVYDSAIKDRSAAMAKLALQLNGMLTDQVNVTKSNVQEGGVNMDRIDDEIAAFAKRLEAEGEFD
ncbi:helix-turn-helix domain-containing protein [Priestia koreensis]|uniref:helix-turn-helix domain-containing protein n=1 Tax=Priestia koreensis TaxID=284581 RepID=UPI00301AD3C8